MGMRHVTRLSEKYTAQEIHQAWAFPTNAKCGGCWRRPLLRAITLAPLADARSKWPEIEQLSVQELVERTVTLKGASGQPVLFVRIGVAYSCASCAKEMEQTLAKLPSWVLVEINRGPAAPRLVTTAGHSSGN